ncbi:MAG: ABC transporter permease [Alistipes sp.]|nr:ABC transporter permease [Alistipes sp.]
MNLIFSDSGAMLILLFAMLIYTTIYSIAYGAEVVESVPIAVVDEDNTSLSRRFVDGLRSGPNTQVRYQPSALYEAKQLFYNQDVSSVLYIPDGFSRDIYSGVQTDVTAVLDGSHLLLYRGVLEQATADVLMTDAVIEVDKLIASGAVGGDVEPVVEPISYNSHVLYNSSLGYGSFVMPSILVVIIQQTLLIGVAMVAIRRRERVVCLATTYIQCVITICVRMLVYILIYAVSLTIALGVIWPIFGFPYNGSTRDVVLLMFIYMAAAFAFANAISYLFKRREAPMLLMLWSSVPVLLLAGVSYPREAFASWLYDIGRMLPSSSAVDAFIRVGSMGASLYNVRHEVLTLVVLAMAYMSVSIWLERYYSKHRAL